MGCCQQPPCPAVPCSIPARSSLCSSPGSFPCQSPLTAAPRPPGPPVCAVTGFTGPVPGSGGCSPPAPHCLLQLYPCSQLKGSHQSPTGASMGIKGRRGANTRGPHIFSQKLPCQVSRLRGTWAQGAHPPVHTKHGLDLGQPEVGTKLRVSTASSGVGKTQQLQFRSQHTCQSCGGVS